MNCFSSVHQLCEDRIGLDWIGLDWVEFGHHWSGSVHNLMRRSWWYQWWIRGRTRRRRGRRGRRRPWRWRAPAARSPSSSSRRRARTPPPGARRPPRRIAAAAAAWWNGGRPSSRRSPARPADDAAAARRFSGVDGAENGCADPAAPGRSPATTGRTAAWRSSRRRPAVAAARRQPLDLHRQAGAQFVEAALGGGVRVRLRLRLAGAGGHRLVDARVLAVVDHVEHHRVLVGALHLLRRHASLRVAVGATVVTPEKKCF